MRSRNILPAEASWPCLRHPCAPATLLRGMSSRKRKQAALPSELPPTATPSGDNSKQEPSEPTGTRHVPCHSGELGPDGRLVRFKDAPAHFRPGLTPHQMLVAGMHGGIYFNPKGGSAPAEPSPAHFPLPYPSPSGPRRLSPAPVCGRAWRQVPPLQVPQGHPRCYHQRVPARVARGRARGAIPQPSVLHCAQQVPRQVRPRPGNTASRDLSPSLSSSLSLSLSLSLRLKLSLSLSLSITRAD